MGAASRQLAIRANRRREQTHETLRRNRKPLRSNAAVLQKVRDEFPVKTAVYLSDLTGQPVRTCEYWIANQTLSPEAIWALLRSERGLQFLIAGMDGARPQWFSQLLRLGVVSSVMRRRDADLRLIRRTLDADGNLTAAIARATALATQDEDFHRPYLEALDAMTTSGRDGRDRKK